MDSDHETVDLGESGTLGCRSFSCPCRQTAAPEVLTLARAKASWVKSKEVEGGFAVASVLASRNALRTTVEKIRAALNLTRGAHEDHKFMASDELHDWKTLTLALRYAEAALDYYESMTTTRA